MFSLTLRASALGLTFGLLAGLAGAADPKPDEQKVDLKVGDTAPTFQLRDDRDKTWSSSDSVGKKWVVMH